MKWRALALKDENVKLSIEGKDIKKVIDPSKTC